MQPKRFHFGASSPSRQPYAAWLGGRAHANNGHGFAILLALVGALQSLRSFRRRLALALPSAHHLRIMSTATHPVRCVPGLRAALAALGLRIQEDRLIQVRAGEVGAG